MDASGAGIQPRPEPRGGLEHRGLWKQRQRPREPHELRGQTGACRDVSSPARAGCVTSQGPNVILGCSVLTVRFVFFFFFFFGCPRLSLCPRRQENRDERKLRKSKPHRIVTRMPNGLPQPDLKVEGGAPAAWAGMGARCCPPTVVCSGPQSDTALYTVLTKHPWLIISCKSHDNVGNSCLTNHNLQKRPRGVK